MKIVTKSMLEYFKEKIVNLVRGLFSANSFETTIYRGDTAYTVWIRTYTVLGFRMVRSYITIPSTAGMYVINFPQPYFKGYCFGLLLMGNNVIYGDGSSTSVTFNVSQSSTTSTTPYFIVFGEANSW